MRQLCNFELKTHGFRIIRSREHGYVRVQFFSRGSVPVLLSPRLLLLHHVPHLQPDPVLRRPARKVSSASLSPPTTTRSLLHLARKITFDLSLLCLCSCGCTLQRSSWYKERRWSFSGERKTSIAATSFPGWPAGEKRGVVSSLTPPPQGSERNPSSINSEERHSLWPRLPGSRWSLSPRLH